MIDFSDDLRALRRRLSDAQGYLGLDQLRDRIDELETEMARPDLWDDTDVGQKVTREYGQVKGDVDLLDGMEAQLSDAETLVEMAAEDIDGADDAVDQVGMEDPDAGPEPDVAIDH